MNAGTYSGWKTEYHGKTYVADDFEITETTDKLEVWMNEEAN